MLLKRLASRLALLGFVSVLAVACSDNDPIEAPGGGDPGGGDPQPQTTHKFTYTAADDTYAVLGAEVTGDQVHCDLAGQVCSKCHADKIDELKDSVHFKSAGRSMRVLFPGGGAHGMLDRACGLPSTTGLTNYLSNINLGECGKCHVGRYIPVMEPFFTAMFGEMGVSDPAGQAKQLVDGGLDCLICHAEEYRTHPADGILADRAGQVNPDAHSPTPTGFARAARDNGDFNLDGQPDLVIDMDGDGTFDAPLMVDTTGDGTPDMRWPTIAQDRSTEAIASIGPTTAETCMRCHEHARTGYKRGTLFIEGHDVHATMDTGPFDGAENQCTVCHTASGHKFVRGHMVGGDLAAADYPPPPPGTPADPDDPYDLTCQKCHDTTSNAMTSVMAHTERHLEVIACETCHIPYASGITYSLFGHGGQVSFARNDEGKDTKLIVADMYATGDRADLDADYEAFRVQPMLMWFNGGTSFLAQSLAVRGSPNAKIMPFKPMANGMIFDARFFSGETVQNAAGVDYNAHSMYRFYANGGNADAFAALDMLDMTPDEVRNMTLMGGFMDPSPIVQAMALMWVFPNLVYFDKANFGYEHYMVKTGSPFDADEDGIIDAGQDFNFDMLAAANAGLRQFQGFNGPMGFEADYDWYPSFGDDVSNVISMKLPDGSLIKMFLQMQAAKVPEEQRDAYLAAVANYPSFSNVTLGGHGVKPKGQSLGVDCGDCHSAGGAFAAPMPVGRKVAMDMGPQMGTLEFPVYQWKYYQVQKLVDLGLATTSEQVLAGADIDIDGDDTYVRASDAEFTLNWFMPNMPNSYRKADHATALEGTGLTADDLTWNGGKWMPVLEPVVDYKPTYEILGYTTQEIIWGAK